MTAPTISALAHLLHGHVLCAEGVDLNTPIGRLEIDSRKVIDGDLFWSLSGERHDGHDYVNSSIAHGASAVVVEQEWFDRIVAAEKYPQRLVPVVVVENTLRALNEYARWHRRQHDLLTIGITGSVGKTTTRRLIHAVLSARFQGMQSPRNYNNHFGVPLSLLEIQPRDEFAVLEFGASGAGEIQRLAETAEPEFGVVTAVAPAHLEGFGSLEAICRAKGELVESLPRNGLAILNGDDPLVRRMSGRASCRVVTVGEELHNDVVAGRVSTANGSLQFCIDGVMFDVPVTGRHHLSAAIVSVTLGRELGMTDAEIQTGFRQFQPLRGRSCPIDLGEWTVIDDTYNSNPASMQAACQMIQDWQTTGKRILVVGDMVELGTEATRYHEELGARIAQSNIDCLIAIGSRAAAVAGTAKLAGMDAGCLGACSDLNENLAIVQTLLDCWLQPGDTLLVKGSRSMQMERVVQLLEQMALDRSHSYQSPQFKAA